MSKAIANQIKPFLNSIICSSEAAFGPGCLSIDNVLVAYELNHLIKHKNLESLSGLLRKAKSMGSIWGIAVSRSAPLVSHLLFANDTLIFCQSTSEALSCIRGILVAFKKASGLKINSHKSVIVFSRNVEDVRRTELANILGVFVVPKHEKYFGLPTVVGCLKKELFEGIKDCIWGKLYCWLTKKLSRARRVFLLKSVLQIFPTVKEGLASGSLRNTISLSLPNRHAGLPWGVGEFYTRCLVRNISWGQCSLRRGWGFLLHTHGNRFGMLGTFWLLVFVGKSTMGTLLLFWGHLRLPQPATFQLIGRPISILSELKEATLIIPEHEWKESLIKTEFCFMDADCILGIPLHGADSHDENSTGF
ncbi:hypothetical protein Sango_2886600 [Sesamum angolense]|uniref:Reverse transcriptase n=1 Tax=Sesamum angolense TaxID=2727404 RepID=A0AAE1VV79_9LAMI|nr:hypothetical protein Sango_2886600 [Sesamum angolense]